MTFQVTYKLATAIYVRLFRAAFSSRLEHNYYTFIEKLARVPADAADADNCDCLHKLYRARVIRPTSAPGVSRPDVTVANFQDQLITIIIRTVGAPRRNIAHTNSTQL